MTDINLIVEKNYYGTLYSKSIFKKLKKILFKIIFINNWIVEIMI